LASRLKRGDGLVGRVFASGKPEFTNDVGAHLSVYKAPLADHVGIQTACAFPVLAGEERIVGVLEFFAEKRILPTEQRLAYMASVGTLLAHVIERKRAEQALRELNETLRQRARDLQRLATQLSLAEQHQRSRLAKLLHDDLQQLLVAASLRLACLAEGAQDERKQEFAKIDALLQDCQMISRDLSHELSPPFLKQGTLADVVAWLAEWFGDKHGLTVAVDAPRAVPAATEHLRVFLFQAVRELLFNAVKHSGSTAARVILSCQDDNLTVQVEDGGICFDPHAVEAHLRRPKGFGLFSIRERLQALGGRLEIERTRQGGACCRLVVPLAGATEPLAESAEPEGVEMATWGDSRSRSVIRLLVVDDHALVREGFVSLLNRQPT
jgi:signal transduction histidine kinase